MKHTNTPTLRFGEFDGEWSEKRLGDIGTFTKGKGISKNDIVENGSIPCIRYGELYTKYNEIIDKVSSFTNVKKDNLVLSQSNDIIIPSSGETAIDIATASCVVLDDIALGGDLNIIRTQENGIFLSYCLNNAKKYDIAKLSQGSSVRHLYSMHLQSLKIKLPTKSEQQKIATFLATVDSSIEQLSKKEQLLSAYKKGVMQKIFSRQIRFKRDDGGEFSKWENISMNKVFKERKTYSTKANNYEHISLTKEGVVPKTERYERNFLVGDDTIKKYKITYINDICYNPANLKFGVICRNKYGSGIFSPIYITFEVLNANIKFIEYLVTRKDFINKVRKYEEGTVYERQAVKPSDFLRFSLLIPSLPEQTKIANFLSSLDKQIEQVQSQLDLIKKFKKSLLQQMFI